MAFTAADVKNLREMTGVGMMDCKKALTASDGDMDKAVEWLREKGMAASAKKAGRIAAEGMVYAAADVANKVGVVIEVNAETDFVAKNADFKKFVADLATVVMLENPADVEALKTALSEHLFTLLEANIAAQGANSLQIVDKWIDYSMIEEGSMRAHAVLEVHRDIATTRNALAREG